MNLAPYIDHTILAPTASEDDIKKLCQEAILYQFKAVCVSPCYAKSALNFLQDAGPLVASVVGFSSGTMLTQSKVHEAQLLTHLGVHELDMVLANYALRSGRKNHVLGDMKEVIQAAKAINPQVVVKVIIETSLLNDDEIAEMAKLCVLAKADFVKTSSGFHGAGANVKAVEIIRDSVAGQSQIKASGGIKNIEFARELIAAGAHRLGTSSGVALVQGKSL